MFAIFSGSMHMITYLSSINLLRLSPSPLGKMYILCSKSYLLYTVREYHLDFLEANLYLNLLINMTYFLINFSPWDSIYIFRNRNRNIVPTLFRMCFAFL